MRGLPNQPLRRSRRQPTRDRTEIGIAEDLALVAELEEVAEVFLQSIEKAPVMLGLINEEGSII